MSKITRSVLTFFAKALKVDKQSITIYKTDSEIVRYAKMDGIKAEKERFANAVQKEEEVKKRGLNVAEKQILYHQRIKNLPYVYNRHLVNDENLNVSYLLDKKNYDPAGVNSGLWGKLTFTRPWYAGQGEYSRYPDIKHYIVRILGSAIAIKAGYEFSLWEAKQENEIYNNNKCVWFENEEQIFDLLYNKGKVGVFLYLYVPGHSRDAQWLRTMETESLRPEYEDIQFMFVHCRKHVRFCINKIFPERINPYSELYMLNDDGQIQLSDIDNFHRSGPGIRGFFEDCGVIEQEYHPEAIFERCGQKVLDIV